MELPCDPSDFCLVCRILPPDKEVIFCDGCDGHWHMKCLRQPLLEVPEGDWFCPDCLQLPEDQIAKRKRRLESIGEEEEEVLVRKIKQIQSHPFLDEKEKAKILQELLQETRQEIEGPVDDEDAPGVAVRGLHRQHTRSLEEKASSSRLSLTQKSVVGEERDTEIYAIFKSYLSCEICHRFPNFIVTTPCGHNFCGGCVKHLKTCTTCYSPLPLARNQGCTEPNSYPRTNFVLECAIRLAKSGVIAEPNQAGVSNEERPDKAFTTSNAKLPGLANACSGRIYATVPDHYLGPITAEYDVNKRGVRVGDTWENRLALRQSGAHRPHVTAFAGTVGTGCPSIVLSKGYDFDIDHGDYFICTGCGGCDLSNNKRTGKLAFDQTFSRANQAMRESCIRGYPVRVIRSCKIQQSKFKPQSGLRYDGIYRIEMCWRIMIDEGIRVCRFLFVRCENEPATWRKTKEGDKPRKPPVVEELKDATDVTKRTGPPLWDFQAGVWGWRGKNPSFKSKPVPEIERFFIEKDMTVKRKIVRDLQCAICTEDMSEPILAPCGHMYCKTCLDDHFNKLLPFQNPSGYSTMHRRERKAVQRCPKCPAIFGDMHFDVNVQLRSVIEAIALARDVKPIVTPPPGVALRAREVKTEVKAEVKERGYSSQMSGPASQPLGKRKGLLEDRQQRARMTLMQEFSDPPRLTRKQKHTPRKTVGLSSYSRGEAQVGKLQTGRFIQIDGSDSERPMDTPAKSHHEISSASGGQDEEAPVSPDSAPRHYKRRKRGEGPAGSGSKRSCELVSTSEGSGADGAGSPCEAPGEAITSADYKRRKTEDDRAPSMQASEAESGEKRDRATMVESSAEKLEKGDGDERIEGVADDNVVDVRFVDVVQVSVQGDGCHHEEEELEVPRRTVKVHDAYERSGHGPPSKEQPPLESLPADKAEHQDKDVEANTELQTSANDVCIINVEVVQDPVDVDGEIVVEEIPVAGGDVFQQRGDNSSVNPPASEQQREEDGAASSKKALDAFCEQIRSLANREGPKEQSWGLLTRCMQEFRQSWTQGTIGALSQTLGPTFDK